MGLFSGSDPFRDEFASLLAEYDALSADDAERIRRFKDYRCELESTRETDLDNDIAELDYGRKRRDDGEPRRHRFKLPLGQALTIKHAYRTAGRLPDAVVDRREETPEERHRSDVMEKMWWDVVRCSNGDSQFASAAWDASQLGAACIEVYFNPEHGKPYIRSVDPTTVLVVKGVSDPHNFRRVFRYWTAPLASVQNDYRGKLFRDVPIPVDQITADSVSKLVTLVQVADPQRTVRFAITGDGKRAIPLYELNHNYGFANYVVIPNLGPESRVWGWADYENVREIARYIPVALGREADVLKVTSGGAYTATGTGQTSQAIKQTIASGGVIQVKKEGSVDPIQPPQVPAFAEAHLERTMELFRMLGFAPAAAWGEGGAQSGSDRGLQLGPLLELTALKQLNWSGGLQRVAAMVFKMIEGKQAGSATYYGTARRSAKRVPFGFTTGPDQTASVTPDSPDGQDSQPVEVTMDPRKLIAGDYSMRFNWQARLDQDDPAYVASEINKFVQGVQSLRSTLERLGFDAPEDEIKLIEQEAEDHPWLRQGMIKLLEMQFNANQQGQGGGAPADPAGAMSGAVDTMTGDGGGASGALNADALTGALPGGTGVQYGQA